MANSTKSDKKYALTSIKNAFLLCLQCFFFYLLISFASCPFDWVAAFSEVQHLRFYAPPASICPTTRLFMAKMMEGMWNGCLLRWRHCWILLFNGDFHWNVADKHKRQPSPGAAYSHTLSEIDSFLSIYNTFYSINITFALEEIRL